MFSIYPPEKIKLSKWDIKYIMCIAFCRGQGRNNAGVKKVYYCIYPSKRPYIDYIYFQTIHKTRYFPLPIEKMFNLFLNGLNSFR